MNWYIDPSTVSSLPSILHVTLVAGPPVELQVSVLVVALNVSSEILGTPGDSKDDTVLIPWTILNLGERGSLLYFVYVNTAM